MQEEEKIRELKTLIQEQKALYSKLMADKQINEKQARKQAIVLVNETQKSREIQLQLRIANKDRRSTELGKFPASASPEQSPEVKSS